MLEDLTVIDFETSGLDSKKDRVIELAAIRVKKGEIISEFSTLVHFNGNLTEKITEITGITNQNVALGMQEDLAFKMLFQFIEDSTLIAHNAGFDLGFLHFSLKRIMGQSFENNFIDTLTICRDRNGYPHTLNEMCARYSVSVNESHRALADSLACWELFKKLNEEESVEKYLNVLGYYKKYGPPKWTPNNAKLVGQEINNLKNLG
ncbi:3'-5' exonuclease [Brevibacillus sp. HB1.4B]|uniref:3'-5' exonuclease n=1 Tax=Brevibacillus sp. HB1.4B TaxID=2738845 RepID=UPI00156AB738|nr:3'-5' exonuclease [Brevibacillus sp. HB1.4B]NRS15861.1 3'-5' exonuclease [Brevibacillus sp. HB1.4B]